MKFDTQYVKTEKAIRDHIANIMICLNVIFHNEIRTFQPPENINPATIDFFKFKVNEALEILDSDFLKIRQNADSEIKINELFTRDFLSYYFLICIHNAQFKKFDLSHFLTKKIINDLSKFNFYDDYIFDSISSYIDYFFMKRKRCLLFAYDWQTYPYLYSGKSIPEPRDIDFKQSRDEKNVFNPISDDLIDIDEKELEIFEKNQSTYNSNSQKSKGPMTIDELRNILDSE